MRPNPASRTDSAGARHAFTLMELLVTLAMLALLAAIALTTMGAAKYKTKTARCASNMRLWGAATSMYLSDNRDCLPYFGPRSNEAHGSLWFDTLAPYVARVAEPGAWYSVNAPLYGVDSGMYTNDVRRCPAGNVSNGGIGNWSTWIGANFGAFGNTPLSGPFYYGDLNSPLSITRIRKPADALAFMDSLISYVYSPVDANYRFAIDYDGDGLPDTMPQYPSIPYNFAQPKIHENGANVTLLDGHVERVPYKLLWSGTFSGTVKHSFWYLED